MLINFLFHHIAHQSTPGDQFRKSRHLRRASKWHIRKPQKRNDPYGRCPEGKEQDGVIEREMI